MRDEQELTEWVDTLLNRHPAAGLAAGVVRDGVLAGFVGRGVADATTRAPITEDTVFRIASITKTFTAIAIMQLWEQGRIDLDAPAAEYLRSYRLDATDPAFGAPTVRHLLTHTAGVTEVLGMASAFRTDAGESVPAGAPVPSLAEYYANGLRIDSRPGARFRYTDHGFATLGQIVADLTGQPIADYLREHVFARLGMSDTTLERAEVDPGRLATGYRLTKRGLRPVPLRDWITAAAVSAYSTPRDMARYLTALAAGGAAVLDPTTVELMFDRHHTTDARLAGIGLSFFRVDVGGRPAVEHAGQLLGFDSQVILAPRDGVGVLMFSNGAADGVQWMGSESHRLLARLLGVHDEALRSDVAQRPHVWGDLIGSYRFLGSSSDVRMRALTGAGMEVLVRDDALVLRFLSPIPMLYRGFVLHPDDPDDPFAFRMEFGDAWTSSIRVVFAADVATGDMDASLDLLGLSARRRPAARDPRRWAAAGAAATTIMAAAAVAARSADRRRR